MARFLDSDQPLFYFVSRHIDTYSSTDEENIFNPIGIQTTLKLNPDLRKKRLQMSYLEADISRWQGQTRLAHGYHDSEEVGGAGAYSTLTGYFTMLRHLNLMSIEAGKEVANPILKQETVKMLFTPQLTPEGATPTVDFAKLLEPDFPSRTSTTVLESVSTPSTA
ncbi:hypothetical protein DFP72DRAFT_1074716 [Ephemerocybe angulata]|uniref:Uncharacterized protein n=1 Tax=Ephemerocybe angulata TaxID=980116 RepID=A0A8H6HJ90_9AGAR|nr:hypothetical protein DFP72DRAFT_1074716 [Tulosesus angulatus]